ncbi:MAG TPA: Glu/Leu/Phe/Val dehydrogenase dimerization domain-containing protein [Myxococcota bacterium]
MSIFDSQDFADHEQVFFCRDRGAGLSAIVAIHDSTLGPAVGGCRMWPYATEDDAVRDALRLSRAMTYKNAMADLPHGGGKSVILGDPQRDKSEALLRAFGRAIEGLGGHYIAAEDVGISVRDIEIMGRETRHVAGVSNRNRASGDPSPFTAQGVFAALRVAVEHRLERASLEGLCVAIQGVGSVGMQLCGLLHEAGVELVVTDVNPQAVAEAVSRFGARAVRPEDIYTEPVDAFSPCALGAVLNDETVPKLGAWLVVGSANNQLARPRHGDELASRGVLYAPDYVVNAGGIINVAAEIAGDYDPDVVLEHVERIGERLRGILREAQIKGEAPFRVADAMAREKLEAARAARHATDAP